MHSSFPRIGEHPDEQKLRRANAGLEEGKITFDEFVKAQDQLVEDIVAVQEKAGIAIVTDGLIRWYDPASHMARNLRGFEINGLLRFFDTNTYYRQPIATDEIAAGNGLLPREVEYLSATTNSEIKGVVLGPLSLAAMSLNKTAMKFEDLCLKLGGLLGMQAARMASAGASIVQVEEPWLVRNPEQFDLFLSSFAEFIKAKDAAKTLVAFYFGDANQIYERLTEIKADMIGIDFTYSPGLLRKVLADGFERPLAFGILDGRNTRLENADDIAASLEPVLGKISQSECHITTSCGLEYLPRKYAIKKLELTAQIAGKINGK
jgi:5-methyltetrahydropteroyltriglutamate--homocysteine methyltransferase